MNSAIAVDSNLSNSDILLVNGISDEIQHIPWSQDLSLYRAMMQRKIVTGFTARMYYISQSNLRSFKKFDPTTLKEIILKPGDVVIMGSLTDRREAKLKQTPKLESIFQALPAGGRP